MADVATIKRVESHFENRPSWVVCPPSNDFISQLTPPIEALMECDSKVAIGTDSLSSNTTLSMVAEMAAMPQVPLEVRLRWATKGGAEALGLEDKFGEFRRGLQSGAVVIEGVDFESMQLTPQSLSRRIL
jgi:cytosine/adenosine deaminase-related metal-dependent hydrolase